MKTPSSIRPALDLLSAATGLVPLLCGGDSMDKHVAPRDAKAYESVDQLATDLK